MFNGAACRIEQLAATVGQLKQVLDKFVALQKLKLRLHWGGSRLGKRAHAA